MQINTNILLYTPILEIMRHKDYQILWESDSSLVLHDHYSGIYIGACECDEEAKHVVACIPESAEEVFLFQKRLFVEKLKAHILPDMLSYNSVNLKEEPLPVKLPKDFKLKWMQEEHIPFVIKHYSVKELCTFEHMQDRMKAGILGVFHYEQPVGFIGTHREGSIGMLEVLPQYQRKGLALALQNAMSNELKKQGAYVYGQIIQNNVASFALQKKSGFTVCDEPTYWYFND